MKDRIAFVAVIAIVASLCCLAFMGLGGLLGYERGLAKCVNEIEPDTVYLPSDTVTVPSPPDTVYSEKLVKIKVPYPVHNVQDTSANVDSLDVELPMEWHLSSVTDTCDIYYHGIMAAVDSVKFYFQNTVITNTVVKTDWKMPRLTADLGAGALYREKQVNPYLIGEVRCNAKKTTWGAYGAIDQYGRWGAGLNVTYRINIVK